MSIGGRREGGGWLREPEQGNQIARVTLVEQEGSLSDSTIEFLLSDTLGTPRTVAGMDGEVLRNQGTTPFGQMDEIQGPGFTGHRHDEDLDLIDMRGRLYDPVVRRFLQADPIFSVRAFSEGLNPYTYAFNNPVNWVDPNGLDATCSYTGEGEVTCTGGSITVPPPPPPPPPPTGPPSQAQPQPPPSPGGGATPSLSAAEAQAQIASGQAGAGPQYGPPSGPVAPLPNRAGSGQWGPGNTPGDISPSQGNEQGDEDWRNAPVAGLGAAPQVVANPILHEATPQVQGNQAAWEAAGGGLFFISTSVFGGVLLGGSVEVLGGARALSASERVAQLAEGRLTQIQRERFVTLAVTETKEGIRIISASTETVQASVRVLAQKGEVIVRGLGHAEVTGVNAARDLGLTPTGVAASRAICPVCVDFLRAAGVKTLTAVK